MDVPGLDDGFEQDGFRVRAEWGESGVDMLAGNCTVLLVVDVLSFSTTVDLAVGRGARILPVGNGDDLDIAADGERARSGPLRLSVEDFLGAGAIVAALRDLGMSPVSPEAELAATAFLGTAEVPRAIAGCVSGRELAAHANSDDVVLAGQVGVSSAAPRLVAGVFRGD